MNFGEKLLKFRVDHRLSQEETGNILGIAQTTVSLYENGKANPNRRNEILYKNILDAYDMKGEDDNV